ncbi:MULTISPECIES: hypothetical protein [unclassified Rathayibacter]|nr:MULTISPECIES: hypothetical protein [unclassified Rathayibacter]
MKTGTVGVNAATGWSMTITSSAGEGTYSQGKLGAWSGASTL